MIFHPRTAAIAVVLMAVSPLTYWRPAAVAVADDAQPSKITFDDLKFEIKPDQPFRRSMLSMKIEALDGKRVTIRAWMFPPFQLKGVKNFVLVNDNQQMRFGPGFPLNEAINVDMQPGETTQFSTKPVTVEGIFSIRELKVEGKVYAVYYIEAASAK